MDGSGLRIERADPDRRAKLVEKDGRLVLVGADATDLTIESVRDMVEEFRDRGL